MENKIPIDDLFRDRLLDGREPLNLGAWANMERMLDGKNPYAEEGKKKRRFIFPFLLTLCATLGILGAGYLIKSSQKSNEKKALAGKHIAVLDQQGSVNAKTDKASTPVEESLPSNKNFQTEQPNSGSIQDPSIYKPFRRSTETRKDARANQPLHASGAKTDLIAESKSASDPSISEVSGDVSIPSLNRESGTKKKKSKINRLTSSQVNTADNKEQPEATAAATGVDKVGGVANPVKIETIPMVTVSQKTLRGRDGGPYGTVYDTIERSEYEKVTPEQTSNQAVASLDWKLTNPRYKLLSEQEELAAKNRLSEAEISKTEMESSKKLNQPTSELSSAIASKSTEKKANTGNLVELKNVFSDAYQKIINKIMFRPKPDVYTGMLMGFNASLSNSTHNFGGFHGGLVLLRPVNEYFSFITECKFFYRNNGGYTVNDITQRILDKSTDNSSLAHLQHSIYSYQKDSIVKTYNFKRFYSIELPLMMQFNYRAFALYGGLNLAYNFRLRTTDKSQHYVSNVKDTLLSSAPHSWPVEKLTQIQSSDFGARLGIGYTVGAAFNFSPQLYLDVRLTQNAWDNKKSIMAREISNGVYKVPTMQISLGYRFRKFSPDN